MDVTTYKVRLEFTEDLLGSAPMNKDIYKRFIANKACEENQEEECETIEDKENAGWTTFPKDIFGYFLWDYQIKGFLKEAGRTLKAIGNVKQLRDKVSRYCFVVPRRTYLPDIEKEPLERSLRAETAMGPRICLARSDRVKAGTVIEFQLDVLDVSGLTIKILKELLDYGKYQAIGQWRTGGYGRFKVLTFEEV